MNNLELREKLEQSWSEETAYSETWDSENKARGQCVVTALVVQDHLGGWLMTGFVKNKNGAERHYWNVIEGKFGDIHLDLTWGQYPTGSKLIKNSIEIVYRSKLLMVKHVSDRYNILKDKIKQYE